MATVVGEEFEDRDLSGSTFWGVNLTNSTFRDADFGGSTFFHVFMKDVKIDGIVERLVVNGVDVTDYVAEHDRWYPLRTMLEPAAASECRAAWDLLSSEWSQLLERAARMNPDALLESAGGEWSFRDTLRHLVFVRDKWFAWPILGRTRFTNLGLPNTGSRDFAWPGLDHEVAPSVGDVLDIRSRQNSEFLDWLAAADFTHLPAETEVLENGTVPTLMCLHAVLEEEFEHLRYATRDLDALSTRR